MHTLRNGYTVNNGHIFILLFVIDKDLDYSHRAPDEVLAHVLKGGVPINFKYVTKIYLNYLLFCQSFSNAQD